ncbi:hypothetical protein FE257_012560 [Aspergillus nanangensis]|uniref:Uncharacterized protein n=1 Tax=Aspergillus nanangensis TaxID=2582783 RepID=A0AAD4CUU5_ASPNN|nr:hypothetical protein FE257_012560 [Aspergillus nanangensis]
MKSLTLALSALLATAVHARTDLAGCTSSATVNQWHEASMIWFVPETGEICDFPDCGGGRAPPKYDTPGCPLYTGTATLEPSYLPGYGPGATASKKTASATASATSTTTSSATGEEESSATTTATAKSLGSSKTDMTITSTPVVASPSGSGRPSTLKTTSTKAGEGSVSGTGSADSPLQTGNGASALGSNVYGGLVVAAGLAVLAL